MIASGRGTVAATFLAIAALCILSPATLAAAGDAPKSGERPPWCQKGYECVPTKELADATVRLIRLEKQLALMKAQRHLLGWHLTCGLGMAVVANEKFDARGLPAGYCGVGFGW